MCYISQLPCLDRTFALDRPQYEQTNPFGFHTHHDTLSPFCSGSSFHFGFDLALFSPRYQEFWLAPATSSLVPGLLWRASPALVVFTLGCQSASACLLICCYTCYAAAGCYEMSQAMMHWSCQRSWQALVQFFPSADRLVFHASSWCLLLLATTTGMTPCPRRLHDETLYSEFR